MDLSVLLLLSNFELLPFSFTPGVKSARRDLKISVKSEIQKLIIQEQIEKCSSK